jgi:hypothetical protein
MSNGLSSSPFVFKFHIPPPSSSSEFSSSSSSFIFKFHLPPPSSSSDTSSFSSLDSGCDIISGGVQSASVLSSTDIILPLHVPVTVSDKKRSPSVLYPLKFHLPPPESSSDCSRTDSVESHNSTSAFVQPSWVAYRNPITPSYQLRRLYTSNLLSNSISCHTTPLFNNLSRYTSLQPIELDNNSPVNCTVLSYNDYSSGPNITSSLSPIVTRTRVPKRYRIMEAEYDSSLLDLTDIEGEIGGGCDEGVSEEQVVTPKELIEVDSINLSELARVIMDDCNDPPQYFLEYWSTHSSECEYLTSQNCPRKFHKSIWNFWVEV